MNNEPVAWISVLAIDKIGQKFTDVRVSLTKTDVASIPLYTHPVKELTDEEILKVAANKFLTSEHRLVLLFSRELLRKTQEK